MAGGRVARGGIVAVHSARAPPSTGRGGPAGSGTTSGRMGAGSGLQEIPLPDHASGDGWCQPVPGATGRYRSPPITQASTVDMRTTQIRRNTPGATLVLF